MMKRTSFFLSFFFLGVLVLEALVGLHRTCYLSFISISGWGIDLDYCNVEWFALEENWSFCLFLRLYPSTAFQILMLI